MKNAGENLKHITFFWTTLKTYSFTAWTQPRPSGSKTYFIWRKNETL